MSQPPLSLSELTCQWAGSVEAELALREGLTGRPDGLHRPVTPEQIDALQRGGNTCDDWSSLRVADGFDPALVRSCTFHGLIRIGRLSRTCLRREGLSLPVGLYNSRLACCDIGDDCGIHSVTLLARTVVASRCLLANIGQIITSPSARFGAGIVLDGESESCRLRLDLANENGGRSAPPLPGQTPGQAWLWAHWRDDTRWQRRLAEITQNSFDTRPGQYSLLGEGCLVRNAHSLVDVRIGPAATISGALRLENVTIASSADQPTSIGEGTDLVDGIVGEGCRIESAAKADHFVLGERCELKLGARLVHTYLGDNSAIACCEVLCSLIFPAHQQHHNNSFLIATIIGGQSNVAAGATIGSNHNSRAADGEIVAGRGFWPGLCVSLKHNCRFASFMLLAKGDYPAELNICLPFSLVSNDLSADRLTIMPAYWWLYNMYALARNTWKFGARDKRLRKLQPVEYDFLAPDTAEEMLVGMSLLERWTGRAVAARDGKADQLSDAELACLGRQTLLAEGDSTRNLEILGLGVEHSGRKVAMLKARPGYHAYRDMLNLYAVRTIAEHLQANPSASLEQLSQKAAGRPSSRTWLNVGGQLAAESDIEQLREDVKAGRLNTWNDVHGALSRLWNQYSQDKLAHALAILLEVNKAASLADDLWSTCLDQAVRSWRFMADQVRLSRQKDYDTPFRQITYRSSEEMRAVVGELEKDPFIDQIARQAEEFSRLADKLKARLG